MQIFHYFESGETPGQFWVRKPVRRAIRYAYSAALTAGAYGLIAFGIVAGALLALKSFQ